MTGKTITDLGDAVVEVRRKLKLRLSHQELNALDAIIEYAYYKGRHDAWQEKVAFCETRKKQGAPI